MIRLKRTKDTPAFVPDYMARSVGDIDFEQLAREGVRYLAFDADSTLVPYRGTDLAPKTLKFLSSKKHLFKGWCIATNRLTHDLEGVASSIESNLVQANWVVRKPKSAFFKRVLRHFGNPKPHEVAMIGDKLRADIWGGKRAGFITVWVEHLGPDNLMDRLTGLRTIERKLLNRYL